MVTVPISQSRKPRLREVQTLAQVLLASEGWSWVWIQPPGFPKPKAGPRSASEEALKSTAGKISKYLNFFHCGDQVSV